MSETPPVKYISYPRGDYFARTYGSADRLEALGEGYFGMTRVAGINFVISLLLLPFIASWASVLVVIGIVGAIFLLTQPYARKLGQGLDWPQNKADKVALAMGINGCLVFGLIGYFILEHIARKELVRYGIRAAWSGVSKPEFKRAIKARREADNEAPPQFDFPVPDLHS